MLPESGRVFSSRGRRASSSSNSDEPISGIVQSEQLMATPYAKHGLKRRRIRPLRILRTGRCHAPGIPRTGSPR